MKQFFIDKDSLVFGEETAIEAQERFYMLVNSITNSSSEENIIIVAHGTVITLFVSMFNDINAYEFWASLLLPSFAELVLPDYKSEPIVNNVDKLT